MATFEAKVTSKGQITLPSRLRAALHVEPGDVVTFTETESGTYKVSARTGTLRDLKGIVRKAPAATTVDVARWIEEARTQAVKIKPVASRRKK